MDPGEDIIDILYNKNLDDDHRSSSKSPSKVQSSNLVVSHQPRYGFEYHNPPARNYYDDLFQIQRRQFHGLDSVYGIEKRPALRRTDSGTYFSFPSPSRQEKQRRSIIYGQLRTESNNRVNIEWSSKSDDNQEDFLTPESEEPIYDKWSSVELSNGIIQQDNKDDRISSINSDTDGGIYNSIDSGIHEYCSITRVHTLIVSFFLISSLSSPYICLLFDLWFLKTLVEQVSYFSSVVLRWLLLNMLIEM